MEPNSSRPTPVERPVSPRECQALKNIVSAQNDVYGSRVEEKRLIIGLYSTVITVGTISNLLVISSLFKSAQLRTLRNYFIVHLASSDLLLCLVTAPMTLYLTFNLFWDFGNVSCQLVASIQAVNTFVSSLTLAAIALDRYLLVIFPVKWRSQKCALVACLTLVWIVSITLAAPYSFTVGATPVNNFVPWNISRIERYLNECKIERPQMCLELFWDRIIFTRETFTITIFILQYFFPLSALLFVYCNIGQAMNKRMASRMHTTVLQRRVKATRKLRTRIMLLVGLVSVFAICWLPANLYYALSSFHLLNFSQHTYIFCHLVGMASACANPVLYGALNENFRRVFIEILSPVLSPVISLYRKWRPVSGPGFETEMLQTRNGLSAVYSEHLSPDRNGAVSPLSDIQEMPESSDVSEMMPLRAQTHAPIVSYVYTC